MKTFCFAFLLLVAPVLSIYAQKILAQMHKLRQEPSPNSLDIEPRRYPKDTTAACTFSRFFNHTSTLDSLVETQKDAAAIGIRISYRRADFNDSGRLQWILMDVRYRKQPPSTFEWTTLDEHDDFGIFQYVFSRKHPYVLVGSKSTFIDSVGRLK